MNSQYPRQYPRPPQRPPQRTPQRRRRRKKSNDLNIPFLCFLAVWLIVLGVIFLVAHIRNSAPADDGRGSGTGSGLQTQGSQAGSPNRGDPPSGGDTDGRGTAEPPETTPPPVTFTDATILSAGDIIAHLAQIKYAAAVGGGTHDFSNSFKYVKDMITAADYAVANFETTLAGPDVEYTGYPRFNAPDSLLDAIKGAGFDMMLFANNHCYDTNLSGFIRTQEQFTAHNLEYIGAKKNVGDDAYKIIEVNGIKIGMLNYADDLSNGTGTTKTINGRAIKSGEEAYMNLYNAANASAMYDEIESIISKMKADGVDLIIAYMHWGYEYNIKHNTFQSNVAQALCDRGVDVIIGGHPHVVQDADVLTSADGQRKTLCFYSLGNFVSNQNRRSLGEDATNSKYTEGGLIVTISVRKYSTGEVVITKAEQIPTFVHTYTAKNGFYAHEILPLADAVANPSAYGLGNSSYGESNAKEVLGLENAVLGEVVQTFNETVANEKDAS